MARKRFDTTLKFTSPTIAMSMLANARRIRTAPTQIFAPGVGISIAPITNISTATAIRFAILMPWCAENIARLQTEPMHRRD